MPGPGDSVDARAMIICTPVAQAVVFAAFETPATAAAVPLNGTRLLVGFIGSPGSACAIDERANRPLSVAGKIMFVCKMVLC